MKDNGLKIPKIKFMSKLDFRTIKELLLEVRVLVFCFKC